MNQVTLNLRKFTYRKVLCEGVYETCTEVAHVCFAMSIGDGYLILSFYNFTPDGNLYLVKAVMDVVEFDNGTAIE